jgi:hypothetical protein
MIECHLHINVIRTNLKNIIGEYNWNKLHINYQQV